MVIPGKVIIWKDFLANAPVREREKIWKDIASNVLIPEKPTTYKIKHQIWKFLENCKHDIMYVACITSLLSMIRNNFETNTAKPLKVIKSYKSYKKLSKLTKNLQISYPS